MLLANEQDITEYFSLEVQMVQEKTYLQPHSTLNRKDENITNNP